jgi:hypothetical protein
MIVFEKKSDERGPYYFTVDAVFNDLKSAIDAAHSLIQHFGYGKSIDIYSTRDPQNPVGSVYRTSTRYGAHRARKGRVTALRKGKVVLKKRGRY